MSYTVCLSETNDEQVPCSEADGWEYHGTHAFARIDEADLAAGATGVEYCDRFEGYYSEGNTLGAFVHAKGPHAYAFWGHSYSQSDKFGDRDFARSPSMRTWTA